MKGQQHVPWKPRGAEARHHVAGMESLKKPGEAIGEGAASLSQRALVFAKWFGLCHLEVRQNRRAFLAEGTVPGNRAMLI